MTSIQIDIKDGLSSSVAVKGPCRVATTANITLSGNQTIDGVAVVTDDRVLVKNQTTGSDNGIWICDTGPWRRSKDFNKTKDVRTGTMVLVTSGSTGTGIWQVTTADPITIGTTSIAFSQTFLTAAQIAALYQPLDADLTAIAALATQAYGRSLLTMAAAVDVRDSLDAPPYVADRTTLKALDTTKDTVALLKETGREGTFLWKTGDYSTQIAADTAEGIYVKANAIASTVGAWVRQYRGAVFLEWFGGSADGVTTNTAAFNVAIAVLPSTGGAIEFQAGDYLFATAPSSFSKALTLYGQGNSKTTLSVSFATGDFLVATGGYQGYRDLRIRSTVTRTSGAFIKIDTIRARLRHLYLEAPYLGIWLTKNSTLSRVSNVEMRNLTPNATSFGSTGIQVGETGGVAGPDSVQIDHVTVANDTSNHHRAGIRLVSGTATTVESCQFLQGLFSALIEVGNGDSVLSTKFPNCYLDSATTAALYCTATGTGNITRILANGTWFSTASQGSGVVLASMGTGKSNGVEFDGCEIVLNLNDGLSVADAKWTNVRVNGGVIAGNNIGIELVANADTFSVRNATIGQSDDLAGNSTGITLQAGTGNNIEVQNNTMRGNTTAITNSATGAANRIEGNVGYNTTPVGSAITVGASPYTYTAGSRPETVYIIAGTVSGVVQAGVTIANTTSVAVTLAPNESVQVTYSSVPFMNKIQH